MTTESQPSKPCLAWSSEPSLPHSRELMETLKSRNPAWDWAADAASAPLWALEDLSEGNCQAYKAAYAAAEGSRKPRVIVLSDRFVTGDNLPPYVFFKTPLNKTVLAHWLTRNGFAEAESAPPPSGQGAAAGPSANDGPARWKTRKFKLKTWPNLSEFDDDLAMVGLCGSLILTPMSYQQALGYGIAPEALDALLRGAEKRGQLALAPDSVAGLEGETASAPAPADGADGAGGAETGNNTLFEQLLDKFKDM